MMRKVLLSTLMTMAMVVSGSTVTAYAQEPVEKQTYYFKDVVEFSENGFSEAKGDPTKDIKDVHYGYNVGQFKIEGFTGMTTDSEDGKKVFYRTANSGSDITLSYETLQDINKLDGKSKVSIWDLKDGYDVNYIPKKTNMGRGTLIVKYIGADNKEKVIVNENSFFLNKSKDSISEVKICEEGDYEVVLDYAINEAKDFWFDNQTYYQIKFDFKVVSGDCLVYLKDSKTDELISASTYTENGFYIDLVNLNYLQVNIKREDFTTDYTAFTSFGVPVVADKTECVENGKYTITVKNPYSNVSDEKIIYVCKSPEMKALSKYGESIENIRWAKMNGGTYDDEGRVVFDHINWR